MSFYEFLPPPFSLICLLLGILFTVLSVAETLKFLRKFELEFGNTQTIRIIGITLVAVGLISWLFIPNYSVTKKSDWIGTWEIMYEGKYPVQYERDYPYSLTFQKGKEGILGKYQLPEGREGQIFNISTNGPYLKAEYRGYFSGGELEFILTEDKESFLGRYLRTSPKPGNDVPYPADGKYRFWIGKKR